MLILQIALGIVLGFLFIRYLDWIISIGFWLLAVLVLVVILWFALAWILDNPKVLILAGLFLGLIGVVAVLAIIEDRAESQNQKSNSRPNPVEDQSYGEVTPPVLSQANGQVVPDWYSKENWGKPKHSQTTELQLVPGKFPEGQSELNMPSSLQDFSEKESHAAAVSRANRSHWQFLDWPFIWYRLIRIVKHPLTPDIGRKDVEKEKQRRRSLGYPD